MATKTAPRPEQNLLGVYLNDHLAGATAAWGWRGGWPRPPSRAPRPPQS